MRDELLNRELFDTLEEAKVLAERWRHEYNRIRPHSALGYRPPAPRDDRANASGLRSASPSGICFWGNIGSGITIGGRSVVQSLFCGTLAGDREGRGVLDMALCNTRLSRPAFRRTRTCDLCLVRALPSLTQPYSSLLIPYKSGKSTLRFRAE